MTVLSITQIYDTWISVGGNTGDIAVYMTAIALAESGGDTDAVSASDDHGLWQINGIHAQQFPNLWPKRYTAKASARMAKAISGNGTNVGPWCTAWVDPVDNCGHYLAPPPQKGSPAGDNVHHVAAVVGSAHTPPLGGIAGLGAGPTPGAGAWAHLQHHLGPGGVEWDHRLNAAHAALRRL